MAIWQEHPQLPWWHPQTNPVLPECNLQHLTLCKIQQLRPSRLQLCHLQITSSIHWPGVSTQMKGFVKKCPSRMHLSPNLYLPTYPWKNIATDLAICTPRTALPTPCDLLLMTPRIQPSTTIISACNEVCLFQAWHPEHHIVSDNACQYNSAEMKALSLSYRFQHITNSPTIHRVKLNTVKTVQGLLKHSPDMFLSLLSYHGTPFIALLSLITSSVLLMGMQFRTDVSETKGLPSPNWPHLNGFAEKGKDMKEWQKESHH